MITTFHLSQLRLRLRFVGIHQRLWAFDDVPGSYPLECDARINTMFLMFGVRSSFNQCAASFQSNDVKGVNARNRLASALCTIAPAISNSLVSIVDLDKYVTYFVCVCIAAMALCVIVFAQVRYQTRRKMVDRIADVKMTANDQETSCNGAEGSMLSKYNFNLAKPLTSCVRYCCSRQPGRLASSSGRPLFSRSAPSFARSWRETYFS